MILATNGIIQSKAAAAPASGIITTGLQFYVDTENPASYTGTVATWYDLSGNGNNAVAVNAPTYSAAQLAMDLNGAGAHFNLPTKTGFPTGANPRTIGGWYKLKNATNPDYSGIFLYGTTTQHQNFEIMITGNKLTFGYYFDDQQSSYTIVAGAWINVCMLYNGSVVKMFVNGVNVLTYTPAAPAINTSSAVSKIGIHVTEPTSTFMFTRMSYVYNYALSDSEVLQNFNNTKSRFGL